MPFELEYQALSIGGTCDFSQAVGRVLTLVAPISHALRLWQPSRDRVAFCRVIVSAAASFVASVAGVEF